MRNITYCFLVGLPGSGKTTYSNNEVNFGFNGRNTHTIYVNLDDYMSDTIEKTVESLFLSHPSIDNYIVGRYYDYDNVVMYIDGVTSYTPANFDKLLDVVMKCSMKVISKNMPTTFDIVVEQWKLDREVCIHNDKLRVTYGLRDKSSESTIKATPYEIADISDLKEMIKKYDNVNNITLNMHDVHKSDTYDTVFVPKEAYVRTDNEYKRTSVMKSDSWSTGGTWCNCYGDRVEIHGEAQPIFNEFVELLEKIAPKIAFLEYRKVEAACVSTEDFHEYDYYGGCEDRRRWVCDLKKLYDMLTEMGYIND